MSCHSPEFIDSILKKKKSYKARSMDSFKGIKIAVSDTWAFLLYAKYHSSYF